MKTPGSAIVPSNSVHSAVLRTTSLEEDGTTDAMIVPEKTPLGNVCRRI
jgi:hypothetical protein